MNRYNIEPESEKQQTCQTRNSTQYRKRASSTITFRQDPTYNSSSVVDIHGL